MQGKEKRERRGRASTQGKRTWERKCPKIQSGVIQICFNKYYIAFWIPRSGFQTLEKKDLFAAEKRGNKITLLCCYQSPPPESTLSWMQTSWRDASIMTTTGGCHLSNVMGNTAQVGWGEHTITSCPWFWVSAVYKTENVKSVLSTQQWKMRAPQFFFCLSAYLCFSSLIPW